MSAGKYSPTVSRSYDMDQKWWYKNGGGYGNGINPESMCDDDGYDSYGYSGEDGQGPDRAGNCEDEYLTSGKWIGRGDRAYSSYPLIEDAQYDWAHKLAAGIKYTD